jgi:small GTP-binding protein
MNPDLHFKTVMIGDSGVGKTTMVKQMAEGIFVNTHIPTVGPQFVTVDLVVEGESIRLELWDTAGQEVYRALVGFYAREAHGAILVVDCTAQSSLDSAPDWLKFIREESPSVKIILFVNKTDQEDLRTVTTADCEKFAAANGLEVVEGSARTGRRLPEAFEMLAGMMAANAPRKSEDDDRIIIKQGTGQSDGGCC